jgi:hypothetical protein
VLVLKNRHLADGLIQFSTKFWQPKKDFLQLKFRIGSKIIHLPK